jgi:hypothetical protein
MTGPSPVSPGHQQLLGMRLPLELASLAIRPPAGG